jgi:hypothetical protein
MFSDDDIKHHMRQVGLANGAHIANYAKVGIPSDEDRTIGKEPHMAKVRRENQERFELRAQNERSEGSLMRGMKWTRIGDAS